MWVSKLTETFSRTPATNMLRTERSERHAEWKPGGLPPSSAYQASVVSPL